MSDCHVDSPEAYNQGTGIGGDDLLFQAQQMSLRDYTNCSSNPVADQLHFWSWVGGGGVGGGGGGMKRGGRGGGGSIMMGLTDFGR